MEAGQDFAFGEFRFSGQRRELSRDGTAVPLGARAADILALLLRHAGQTVSKDALMAAVWPDRVVEEHNLAVHLSALRRVLGDGSGGGPFIQTDPGRGYRFVGSVSAAEPTSASAQAAPTLPDKPSIAVLPFQNMSGDPEQEYFADGMVEEIITALAQIRWLFVIARNSSFTYKDRPVDVKQVGRDLGVRYVLEGSVRKGGDRIRITAQLIEAETGAHLWAGRFDGSLENVFDLQDEVASSVACVMDPTLRIAEMRRIRDKRPQNLNVYDLHLRAFGQIHKYSRESVANLLELAWQMLSIDPDYAPAAAMVGWCRVLQRVQHWVAVSDEQVAEGVQLARAALERARGDPDTLWIAAVAISFLAHDHATAAGALDRALALNPNSFSAWAIRGWIACYQSDPRRAIDCFDRALRLNPLDPLGFEGTGGRAFAHLIAGEYEVSVEWADRSLADLPRYAPALRTKIAALVQLGRLDEARSLVGRMQELLPGQTIAGYRLSMSKNLPPPVLDLLVDALRRAGLPEA